MEIVRKPVIGFLSAVSKAGRSLEMRSDMTFENILL